MLRREFISGVRAGEVKFQDHVLSVPAPVAGVLGPMLDQFLPEGDVLGGMGVTDPGERGTASVEWYLVMRGLLIKVVGSIAPGPHPPDALSLTLEHEFLPIVRITTVRASVDRLESRGNGVAQGTAVEILHERGSWMIDPERRLKPVDVGRFVSALLREFAR
ncbi:MAG TPA: hypothetical protein VMS64_18705 [Candidatus Methylomirabilis sp.]|nr:hypothetical protein [Candidatus Methylomirabilis sp.]